MRVPSEILPYLGMCKIFRYTNYFYYMKKSGKWKYGLPKGRALPAEKGKGKDRNPRGLCRDPGFILRK
ncbi:MAG: hypothetical protein BAA03_15210 [Caldibacillus debilis]|nr:MAG: hypothetical protein BAA03_15210 [Caldibacillus debilis]